MRVKPLAVADVQGEPVYGSCVKVNDFVAKLVTAVACAVGEYMAEYWNSPALTEQDDAVAAATSTATVTEFTVAPVGTVNAEKVT